MRKILTILMLLALAIPMWAGEKTITISRNDVDWESANTVYNISKGGVQLKMSGGMNNPNFLLMKQNSTISVTSYNFNIKRIVFHCLDNYTNDNLEPFYWGPTTLHIQYNQTHAETAGTLTYNYGGSSYDALWVSTKSSSPGNYPNGLPANYELMFQNEGKPVRFASIDVVVEQEVGDIYELVTSQSEIQAGQTYILVGRQNQTTTTGRALSVKESSNTPSSTATRISTPVDLLENGYRVKTTGEVQLIKLEATGNDNRPYYLKVGSNYLRRRSSIDGSGNNYGSNILAVSNIESGQENYFRTSITINGASTYYNALIRFAHNSSETEAPEGGVTRTFAIRHRNSSGYFRDIDYSSNNGDSQYQRVYLYKPAQQYKVTTEVQPGESYGSISLRDGILLDNGTNWSQKMDTVQFLVTAANGKKISNIDIQALENNQVVEHINPLTSSQTINGTLYTFVMPGHNVNIVTTFEEVQYHNINIVVNPSGDYGNVFLTEGYVVQNDQVKSYEGENVVFNVTPNPIDIEHEENGYHELYSVTVTYTEGGQTISYTYTDGNYNFTMPDADVTITATFIYNNNNPLFLLGTANGETEWHPYGPRFNYDPNENQYYLDVYFKGTSGDYSDYNGGELPEIAHGHFNVVWGKWSTWDEVNSNDRRGIAYTESYEITPQNPSYTLVYDNYKASQTVNNPDAYSFKIKPGIYRIYVKSYGYHNDVLTISKTPTTLTFDPAGGASAAEAVEIAQGTEVSLNGNIYNLIEAINPDEADANFFYKTNDEAAVNGTSSTTVTLNDVNEGETVTELEGINYLGWITASNTAYYKVIETPLHWIEKFGDKGTTYTVSDRLLGVYVHGSSLWCKDLGNISIAYTEPAQDQIDFLAQDNHTARPGGWDQSNWVELDFSGLENGQSKAEALVDAYIKAGSVKGEYADDLNYRIKLNADPVEDDGAGYNPNYYCTVNFLEANLMLTESSTGPKVGNTYYYFLNPKIQEYAIITYAMWDKAHSIMVVPDNVSFDGAVRIGSWDYNKFGNQKQNLDNAFDADPTKVYQFHILVQRDDYTYGNALKATGKTDQTPSSIIKVQPLDLQVTSTAPTAITGVATQGQVVGVDYVNIAGAKSSKPWQGINIVVTRYSDGTTTTTKMVK